MSPRNRAAERARNRVGSWLVSVHDRHPNEEADECEWPACHGPMEVHLELAEDYPEGWPVDGDACLAHGREIVEVLSRAEIRKVTVYVDDTEDYSAEDQSSIEAIEARWPGAVDRF